MIRRLPPRLGAAILLAAAVLAGCATISPSPPELRFEPAGLLAGHEEAVLDVRLSKSGTLLASASMDDTAGLWDLRTGARLRTYRHPDDVYSVAFHPAGELVATACRDGLVRLFRVDADEPVLELEGHGGAVTAVAFSPDGSRLASAGEDLSARMWDVATGQSLRVLTGHTEKVQDVAYSPDGKLLATGSSDDSVRLWRASDGGLVKVLRVTNVTEQVSELGLDFSADSSLLLSGGGHGTGEQQPAIREWSVKELRLVRTLTGHGNDVWKVRYLPGGAYLAAAGRDGKLTIWSRAAGSVVAVVNPKSGSIWSFAATPDGREIYLGTAEAGIRVYRLPGGVSR